MSASTTSRTEDLRSRCLTCGAWCDGEVRACWHCGGDLERLDGPPMIAALDGQTRRRDGRFSLATILTAVTLLAVSLAVMRFAPGLGLVLAALVTPAVVRTQMTADGFRLAGQRMTRDQWMQALVWSSMVAYLAASAAVAAFVVSALLMNVVVIPALGRAAALEQDRLSMFAAAAVAIAVGGLVFWIARPRRR